MTRWPRIVGITPFERPDVRAVRSLARAGALGCLDLGGDPREVQRALAALARGAPSCAALLRDLGQAATLPDCVTSLVLPEASWLREIDRGSRAVFVQVCSVEEAREAVSLGAHGLIVKGNEAGGRVGSESTLILLQRVAAEVALPCWAQGGIGQHGAAAAIAGGAHGVVLDSQLACLPELTLPEGWSAAAFADLDGSETALEGDVRRLAPRPASAGGAALACGQDIAFARPLAERYGSIAALVPALERSIDGHLHQARALMPLSEHAPFAQAYGVRYPVVQGPMTRVSDRPAFASAVATAGAIPFLALSLMQGKDAARLLAEAAALLAGRTWGVGILGFAPAELRKEQLALLEEVKPPLALIAGGRPAQARSLEDKGIRTFLHVPSPGLLEHFLRDGARRFVFEGRECGGHVGPRSSFVLWEQAVATLLAFDAPHEIDVLFAGGIHDARSAAMVSALCAPLAARGARVGVLMGTAYLFTREAVATEAIVPAFQRAALQCSSTALLESAPGHATRAAVSPFVAEFEARRRALQEGDQPAADAWAELEQLNVGRLRIAAKGLQRDGAELRGVDERDQLREGLYMMGQVAVLRDELTTLATLHDDVCSGSARLIAALPKRQAPAEDGAADVAVVGMACVFPDAEDLDAYWRNVLTGRDCIREVPETRWNRAQYYDPEATPGKTVSKWGGFLPATVIDPREYGIPPRSMGSIDPAQLLALHVARQALADAGLAEGSFDAERTSVIFGAEAGTEMLGAYLFRCTYPQLLGALPPALDEHLPALTEDSFPGVLSNVISGRISNRLDLGGVNYTINAACASSLAALDAACKELTAGTSDVVVAGAAEVHNHAYDYAMFTSVGALSSRGRCKTFDAEADGIVLGEGVAALVLKRRADAERDGDRIYAVMKSVAGASDGRALGLTAPRKQGQRRALERAYEAAGMSPGQLELIEAHGTGTVVGDRTELEALTELMSDSGGLRGACALGSVKSQIGHTRTAAGFAGLIKAALSIHHGVIPPTRGIERPNAYYHPQNSPFAFHEVAKPWLSPVRRAGVSAFGFGGTNFHAVLQSAGTPPASHVLRDWDAELFLLRGKTEQAALVHAQALLALARAEAPAWSLLELATMAARTEVDEPVQMALVAESAADLAAKLEAVVSRGDAPQGVFMRPEGFESGKIAFLFPGQGSQRPNALRELFVLFPAARERLAALPPEIARRLYPEAAHTKEARLAQRKALADTRAAQPALAWLESALAEWLTDCGVRADLAGGHSFGELAALAYAGSMDFEALGRLSAARAAAMAEAAGAEPSGMAAVDATTEQVEARLRGIEGVAIANENAPAQVVISGVQRALQPALRALEQAGLRVHPLDVGCAFHSPLMQGSARAFAEALAKEALSPPAIQIWSNVTAQPHAPDAETIRARLCEQLTARVRFSAQIESMYEAGARVFVEVGPGRVLSGLVGKTLGARPHRAIAFGEGGSERLRGMLEGLAELAALGVRVDAPALLRGRDCEVPAISGAAPRRYKDTAWLVDGHLARPAHGPLPKGALKALSEPLRIAGGLQPVGQERELGLLRFLDNMRELAETQRQVMLHALGAENTPPLPRAESAATARTAEPAPATTQAQSDTVIARDPVEALVQIVSARTGYPLDMLEPELDLEADLGIDSIKRVEIVSTLVQQLGTALQGAGFAADTAVEELSGLKTLRAMQSWIRDRIGGVTQASAAEQPPRQREPEPAAPAAPAPAAAFVPALSRYRLELVPLPAAVASDRDLTGALIAIDADDRGVADALEPLLAARGARVLRVGPEGLAKRVDGLVHLASLGGGSGDPLGSLMRHAQQALRHGARFIVAATTDGGRFGRASDGKAANLRPLGGLLKCIAAEYPSVAVRLVDMDGAEAPLQLARQLDHELPALPGPVEVGYAAGVRHGLSLVAEPLAGAGQPALELGPDSVILVTGGARGISAAIAVGLARRFGCKLELLGRSALPAPEESAATIDARDAAMLRRALARALGPGARPRDIEQACQRILAEREMRAVFEAIVDAGGQYAYHSVDVRDGAALAAIVGEIYVRHGRLTGVIHGAGVIEDQLFLEKCEASFRRVFDTKVAAAQTLVRSVREDAAFIALFSSVSSVLGNRGQADYAAANEALDRLACQLGSAGRRRVFAVNWGPWTGRGMVSPELSRTYERRGVALISEQAGVDAFIEELVHGQGSQVVLLAGSKVDWGA